VTLNVSTLSGTNVPALIVAFNNSGTWEEVPWEWSHQRGDSVKVNDAIRFRVNVFNNTLQKNYWIFTTDNASMPPRNVSLFLFYDGFEVGNVDGWTNETGVHFEASNRRSANGGWCGNKSDATNYYEAFYDFPFDLNNETNITICGFVRWETNVSINLLYLLQNITGAYTNKTRNNVLETWFFNEGRSGSTQTIRIYDNGVYILGKFLFGRWYAWCYKDIDTRDEDINSDFWVNSELNHSDVSGWHDHGVDGIDTVDGISLANSANKGYLSEGYIDEVYVSVGYDYNIYETVPEIRMGDIDWNVAHPDLQWNVFKGADQALSVTLNKPPDGTIDFDGDVTFSCSFTDDSKLENATFYVWDSAGQQYYNDTKIISGTSDSGEWKLVDIPDGSYEWNCKAYDNASASAWAADNLTLDVYTGSDYRYRLIINLTGAKIENHTLQPVILNISALNGTNVPALMIAFNNSGAWEEVQWEWFHQRGDSVKVNDTIRFRVNVFNNTLQRNYWIFTTDNTSMPPRNVSLFLFYDGFEVGNADGWVREDRVHFEATDRRSANGEWCGNKSDNTCYYEAYYDFPFDLDDKENITICWFARWETNQSINLPYLLQNLSGTYTTKPRDNVLETWFFNEGHPGVTQTIRMYDGDKIYVLGHFLFKTWYAWCYKDIDTRDEDINSDFWVNSELNYSDADGWRNHGVFAIDTIDSISLANSANSKNRLSEAYIDEVYVSVGYDYNIYERVPEIWIEKGIADNRSMDPL